MSYHLNEAEEVVAKAVQANSGEVHGGWSKYVPAGAAAVQALIEAGWAPPGDGTADERLRQAVLEQQGLAREAWEHLGRKEAELEAAGEFRRKFLGIRMSLRDGFAQRAAAARIAHEPEPTYTGEQVMKWLDNMLDRSDKAGERAKAKSLKTTRAEAETS